jgi:hypothetical protein
MSEKTFEKLFIAKMIVLLCLGVIFTGVEAQEKAANQSGVSVEAICADSSEACEDALEDLQAGQVERFYE